MDSQGRSSIIVRRAVAVLALGLLAAAVLAIARGELGARAKADTRLLAGLQMHPLWDGVTPNDWNRELGIARHSYARVVRVDVGWSSLQRDGRGRIDYTYARRFDAFLARAKAFHVGVIVTFLETPCWASTAPSSLRQKCAGEWWNRGVTRYPPRRAGDYAVAAAYVAKRWGSKLEALEIWNEPNVPTFLNTPDPVRAYARLVRTSYPAVKRVAPDLTVLAGSMLLSDGDFLTGLFERGKIAGFYDGISYHPYTHGSPPTTAVPAPDETKWSFAAGSAWLHDIMVAHGDPNPQLWATEAGASTCTQPEALACVSLSKQATYVTDYFKIARTLPYLRALVIYSLRDRGLNRSDPEQNFGLVRLGLSPKPGLSAFRHAARPR